MTGKITTMEVDDYCEYSADMFAWNSIRDELESNGDLFRDELENPLYSIFIYIEGQEEPIDLDNDSYDFPDGKTDAEFYMIIGEDKQKKEMVKNYKHQLRECMTQMIYNNLELARRDYDEREAERDESDDEDNNKPPMTEEEKWEEVWDLFYDCILDKLDEDPVLEGFRWLRKNKKALDKMDRDIDFMDEEELTEGITYANSKPWELDMKLVKKYITSRYHY
jgi:hypothetical protein